MSNHTTTPTLTLAPEPEPLQGLSGAPTAVYTELVATPGVTAAELALAAGLGRSTTGKALVTLEEHGLAVREPGGHEGARRTPDHWRPAQPGTSPAPEAETSDTTEPDPTGTPTPTAEPASGNNEGEVPTEEMQDDRAEPPAEDASAPPSTTEPALGSTESIAVKATPSDCPNATTPPTLGGQKVRLAPGALRQMVIDHLQAHPGEAFTATKISRVIGKSSGAIANALVTLTSQGITEQAGEQPRTYRAAAETSTE